ncbi:MAG: hypothetical protein Q8M17_04285 [Actinomycetota bacterium]|nr:hypothetical protein [Actinomycetota bacterium]
MAASNDALAAMAYALFAFHQPVPLKDLAAASPSRAFPLAAQQTPDWFAAAATGESSLLETAPELQALPVEEADASGAEVTGIDLIRIYAPELQAIDDETVQPVVTAARVPEDNASQTATQLGLLKELGNLEG